MLKEATAAKAEGNRLFGAGEYHSAIAAYSWINNQNPRINDRSYLRLPSSFAPGDFMDDFIRSPMWSRNTVCLAPNVAPLIKIIGLCHPVLAWVCAGMLCAVHMYIGILRARQIAPDGPTQPHPPAESNVHA